MTFENFKFHVALYYSVRNLNILDGLEWVNKERSYTTVSHLKAVYSIKKGENIGENIISSIKIHGLLF